MQREERLNMNFLQACRRGAVLTGLLSFAVVAGCGAPSPGSPGTKPASASLSFTLAVSPTDVSLSPGNSQSLTVTLSSTTGLNSPVNVEVSGSAPGILISPTSFAMKVGISQEITISTTALAELGNRIVTLRGAAG